MKLVVLDCRGRLANQVLCYANARYVLAELGLTDRTIVINYSMPPNCVRFPGAIVQAMDTSNLPTVSRYDVANHEEDVLWNWTDVYSNFPPAATMKRIIQSIELEDSFADQIKRTINGDNMVGIHARFGDYVKVDEANPPDPLPPFVRAHNAYFLNAMALCRDIIPDVKFFLASNGTSQELEFLTGNKDVTSGWSEALFDLFALSQCRLIIGSASTFSSVAADYGDVPLILPTMFEEEIRNLISA